MSLMFRRNALIVTWFVNLEVEDINTILQSVSGFHGISIVLEVSAPGGFRPPLVVREQV